MVTLRKVSINALWTAFAMAALISAPALADSASGKNAPPAAKPAITLRILQPIRGATWYFSSKQVIEWSISGLPSGNYSVAGYLKGARDGKKGLILINPVENGRAQVNYVVNEIDYGGKSDALKNGRYEFSLALYRKAGPDEKGLGELILEKRGGRIKIKDSDADMRPGAGPGPTSKGPLQIRLAPVRREFLDGIAQ